MNPKTQLSNNLCRSICQ